ncbi:class I SAM-dependent methyltransferase [Mesorhizobium sp. YM1C-6-2]|uniref:class I SAM-dependent methyltransferase n=1 Tax=Mesorhizobium sp. YM1C-6-2 TaxID=1827501 RepID=UPI000EF26E4B|nr:class I SAM-dependent methyltransferase [Mesorhizobium sp. YM1C-6-2]RLP25937.1 class I SAM-dependent methyltransferase [Mesorhizobium sp. YM1C-6-2]
MSVEGNRAHWDNAYATKGEAGVSWFEDVPAVSLELIRQAGAGPASSVIDIGGGASRLADALLREGVGRITVLDISPAALDAAKARVGAAADDIEWIAADVTEWKPERRYDIWHDRAAFHFLTEADARAAYVERLRTALKPGGHAVIATFALDGPERCSGLPVMRYDPAGLAEVLGPSFELVGQRRNVHTTPWGSPQSFQFSLFRRVEPR